jgi:signal transduction histidine kinase/CheY-like chemotaxis protein
VDFPPSRVPGPDSAQPAPAQPLPQREAAADAREAAQRVGATAQAEAEARNRELRQANEHLVIATLQAAELKDAAEAAHQRQDEFLAMLAHELRNPLAPIRSAMALLERPDCTEAMREKVYDVIKRQVHHMGRLIDDLLDASRLTQGKVILQRQPTAVAEFVQQAVENAREMIDAQHQRLTLDTPAAPLFVDGDPVRLLQIVGNLLHNAAKYTPPGGSIAVTVRPHGDRMVIRIVDNGVGIAAESLPFVFDMFTQGNHSLSRSQGGLGIGLTVVRRMVELHGGTVEARSAGLGQGSEFVVSLPRLMQVEPRAQIAAATVSPPMAARIVVIEDNVDAADTLAMLLRLSGHEVDVAFDGPSGLDLIEQRQPRIVLCDVGLPGMDGYEVARQVRQRGQVPAPVMIALTGYDGATDRARALAAGFDHHMAKPADIAALEHLIGTAVLDEAAP